jgi:hypothetical protein
VEFIICGDININYLQDTPKKKQLNSLLLSFNLFCIIDFPTRSQNNAVSLIDNIFTDYSQDGKYQVFPLNTGLPDHDPQLLIIRNVRLQIHKHKKSLISAGRIFNEQSLLNFKIQLSYEMWEDVYNGNDTDTIFNSYLHTYLRIFYSSFPLKKIQTGSKTNAKNWITSGIRISCRRKRELYLSYRNSTDVNFKNYYKLYSRTLSNVINAAKRSYYDRLIANSENKMKATWNIIRSLTGKRQRDK